MGVRVCGCGWGCGYYACVLSSVEVYDIKYVLWKERRETFS